MGFPEFYDAEEKCVTVSLNSIVMRSPLAFVADM